MQVSRGTAIPASQERFQSVRECKPSQFEIDVIVHLKRLPNSKDINGSVDFREFLIGLSLLSQPANNEEIIKYAFKVT